ncbi:MAG: hypothetical protein GX495_10050 [Chloroflexi bacterium]|mgnify:CR=1 FL=1|jgi:hypothetical protein|nr:hypothetical protein [Chloroflexota bacterium]
MLQVHVSSKFKILTAVVLSLVLLSGLGPLAQTRLPVFASPAQDGVVLYFPLIYKNFVPRAEESIMILTPASGSRVTSPIHISGVSDPTFEQNLVVRVLLADGTVVAEEPTTIQADTGERGPFELDLPVDLTTEQPIFIQVFASSPRDGGTTHLSSVGVTFTPSGPEDILTRSPYLEEIAIFTPVTGASISGGTVQVRGFGLASFEQTLVIEVLDEDGNVVGTEPVIVDAPDLGEPGPFHAEVEYSVGESGPGRIVVRDVSPAFGGDTHLSSVEVNLAP